MHEETFSKPAHIDIQGPYALNFISLSKEAVEFEIIGLSDPIIRLIDKRADVRRCMANALKTGNVEMLAQYFNKPARVKLFPLADKRMTVQLDKTRAKKIKHMLWVAIGISGEIPYYDQAVRLQIERFKKDSFALFYLFKVPTNLA